MRVMLESLWRGWLLRVQSAERTIAQGITLHEHHVETSKSKVNIRHRGKET